MIQRRICGIYNSVDALAGQITDADLDSVWSGLKLKSQCTLFAFSLANCSDALYTRLTEKQSVKERHTDRNITGVFGHQIFAKTFGTHVHLVRLTDNT